MPTSVARSATPPEPPPASAATSPVKANQNVPGNKFEGTTSRFYTTFHPKLAVPPKPGDLREPHKIAVQFQHAFVTDADGLKVFDLCGARSGMGVPPMGSYPSEMGVPPMSASPAPRLIATLPLAHAENLYAARTYLYVAVGPTASPSWTSRTPPPRALILTYQVNSPPAHALRQVKIEPE